MISNTTQKSAKTQFLSCVRYHLLIFSAVFLTGCASASWLVEKIDGATAANEATLVSSENNEFEELSFELLKTKEQLFGYLITPKKTAKEHMLTLSTEDTLYSEKRSSLMGGQKISLSQEMLTRLIDTLIKGSDVLVCCDTYEKKLYAKGFPKTLIEKKVFP